MTVHTVAVERFSLTSAAPFESVMARIDAAVGHPDMRAFVTAMGAAPTVAALTEVRPPRKVFEVDGVARTLTSGPRR